MNDDIADLLERWLDSSEIQNESLQATNQFGLELESICRGTPLDGRAIRDKHIPFGYGLSKKNSWVLRRLLDILREDPDFDLSKQFLSGADNRTIIKSASTRSGGGLSKGLKGKFVEDDVG